MTCMVCSPRSSTLGSCNGLAGNDEMDRYFQRSDSITLSAGDAKQANAVTHTINPWPRYVGDRRIVVGAAKMERAIPRYRSGTQYTGLTRSRVGRHSMGIAGATAATVDAGGGVVLGGGGVGGAAAVGAAAPRQ